MDAKQSVPDNMGGARDSGYVRDRAAAERWISENVQPTGPIKLVHARPWSTVLRVPLHRGAAWFKACGTAQAFEPRLSAELFARWPDRVAEVLAYDERRAWLLLGDAGTPIGEYGNPPEAWLEVLPPYADLQRGEAVYANDHIAHGVPSLPVSTLAAGYAELVERDLPLEPDELVRLRAFSPRFEQLCAELATGGVPPSVQHDDLHMGNVYELNKRLRLLDWGDSSISHPFFSLVVTFRFLEERTGLWRHDRWFARLRDAYLEPWGQGPGDVFDLAVRVGRFAHTIAWARQREVLAPTERTTFDATFARVLRRALDTI
jgi:hypothetical protein